MFTSLKSPYARMLGATVRTIAETGIHPNVLTVTSLLPAVAAGMAAAFGDLILAALLLLVSGAFDVLDGALARLTKKESVFGALLDSTLDRVSDAAVPMGLVLFYAPHGALLLVPAAAMLSGFLVSYVRARAEGLLIRLPRLWMRREDRIAVLVVALFLAPVSLPGSAIPASLTLFVVGLLAALGFLAAGAALLAAADRS